MTVTTRYRGVGIDACRGGWFAVARVPTRGWQSLVFRTIRDAWAACSEAGLCLIDIPIGLAQEGARECDLLARRLLGRRGVSVFTPPCRAALAARTYGEASAIHFKHCGRRLTIQSWNIAAKIVEVDCFLNKTSSARGRMRESHPEVCFAALAGRPPLHPKKSQEGFRERLALLQPFVPEAEQIVGDALARFPRSILGRDDILDALVLALCAALPLESLASLPATPPQDSEGLPMEIVFPNIAAPEVRLQRAPATGTPESTDLFGKGAKGRMAPPPQTEASAHCL